jgi:hypothetical protein
MQRLRDVLRKKTGRKGIMHPDGHPMGAFIFVSMCYTLFCGGILGCGVIMYVGIPNSAALA